MTSKRSGKFISSGLVTLEKGGLRGTSGILREMPPWTHSFHVEPREKWPPSRVFHVEPHLPMQKREKISPSKSSAPNAPVIRERLCCPNLSSSAINSKA